MVTVYFNQASFVTALPTISSHTSAGTTSSIHIKTTTTHLSSQSSTQGVSYSTITVSSTQFYYGMYMNLLSFFDVSIS